MLLAVDFVQLTRPSQDQLLMNRSQGKMESTILGHLFSIQFGVR